MVFGLQILGNKVRKSGKYILVV